MTEAKRRFSSFEEGYQLLRDKWHNFEVGSPDFQAMCDFNDRENFHQERDNALQLLAKMRKDNNPEEVEIQTFVEARLNFYQLRYTQTLERIEQRSSTTLGYSLALTEISSEARELSSLHPEYDGENIHDEALFLLAEVKSNILYIPVDQQLWRKGQQS